MREGAIVPEVTLVGEAVADETELALLDILLDGVEQVCLTNLHRNVRISRYFGVFAADCGAWRGQIAVLKRRLRGKKQKDNSQKHGTRINAPPSLRWSILGSQRSCSGWSVAHWHTEEYRGRGRLGRHPSRCRCGAPKYLVQRPYGWCIGRPYLRSWENYCLLEKKRKKKMSPRNDELSVESLKFYWTPVWA